MKQCYEKLESGEPEGSGLLVAIIVGTIIGLVAGFFFGLPMLKVS